MRRYITESVTKNDLAFFFRKLYNNTSILDIKDDESASAFLVSRLVARLGLWVDGLLYEPIPIERKFLLVNENYISRICMLPVSEVSEILDELYDIGISSVIRVDGFILADGNSELIHYADAEDIFKQDLPALNRTTRAVYKVGIDLLSAEKRRFAVITYDMSLTRVYDEMGMSTLTATLDNPNVSIMGDIVPRITKDDMEDDEFQGYYNFPYKPRTASNVPFPSKDVLNDTDIVEPKRTRTRYPIPRIKGLDIDFWDYINKRGEFRQRSMSNEAAQLGQTTKSTTKTRTTTKTKAQSKADVKTNTTVKGEVFFKDSSSPQEGKRAKDYLDKAYKDFMNIKAFTTYNKTLASMRKWFSGSVFKAGGKDFNAVFKTMDDIDRAASLLSEIIELKSKITPSLKVKEKNALKEQINNKVQELHELNSSLSSQLDESDDNKEFKKVSDKLANSVDEYDNASVTNTGLWQVVKSRLMSMKPYAESMDTMKKNIMDDESLSKYKDVLSKVKDVMPSLNKLLNTPLPSMPDINDMYDTSAVVLRAEWQKRKDEYNKALTEFNNLFQDSFNVLSEVVEKIGTPQRSLF